ncbi:MAG: serine/threonine protein kinase [Planctomycetes bacterium]|nr:serine/threonine protein kinase [Planctomycetota bacterium]
MDAERWGPVEAVLRQLIALPVGGREEALARLAGDDVELRREVLELLRFEQRSAAFLECGPVAGARATRPNAPRIGSYSLVERLGGGGMGEVWLAARSDGLFEHRVAIKLLPPWVQDSEFAARLEQERRVLARLRHPNIAQLLDGGTTEDGRPFFVMEHVDGPNILDWCDRQKLGIEARIHLFLDVCCAVGHAHRHLIVHRDIKPANIHVESDGTPKLLDFGIAKVVDVTDTDTLATAPGSRPMTPRYASPEQFRQEPITTASDIFSLGVVLYELLAHLHPYPLPPSATRSDYERAVCEFDPARPSAAVSATAGGNTLARRLAGDLDAIIMRALRKEPEARYASVDNLAEDLQRHLQALPVNARDGTWRYLGGRFVRRNALAIAGAAGVMAASLVGTAVALHHARVADRLRQQAEAAGGEASRSATAAMQQAQRAQRILAFLQASFFGSNPRKNARRLTADEALDAAAGRVETEFEDDPETLAIIHGMLGQSYLSQGRLDRSAHHLERGRQLLQDRHDAPPDYLARILSNLGALAQARGDYDEAWRRTRSALTLLEGCLDAPHEELAIAINNLGLIARLRRDYTTAADLLGQAAAMRTELLGPESPGLAETLNNIAGLERAQGNLAAAEETMRRALDMRRLTLGSTHASTIESTGNLAVLLAERDDLVGAEELVRAALENADASLDARHPDRAYLLRTLAKVIWARGAPGDALAPLTAALSIFDGTYDPDHASVITAARDLVFCTVAAGDRGRAREILQDRIRRVQALDSPEPGVLEALRGDLARLGQ